MGRILLISPGCMLLHNSAIRSTKISWDQLSGTPVGNTNFHRGASFEPQTQAHASAKSDSSHWSFRGANHLDVTNGRNGRSLLQWRPRSLQQRPRCRQLRVHLQRKSCRGKNLLNLKWLRNIHWYMRARNRPPASKQDSSANITILAMDGKRMKKVLLFFKKVPSLGVSGC